MKHYIGLDHLENTIKDVELIKCLFHLDLSSKINAQKDHFATFLAN